MLKIIVSIFFIIGFNLINIAQDIIVTDKNDTIICRIKSISADSSIEYNSIREIDLYGGLLSKGYWKYYEYGDFNNPKNSRWFFSLGLEYAHIPVEQLLTTILKDNKTAINDLSSGIIPFLSAGYYINPYKSRNKSKVSFLSYSFGLTYGYFTQAIDLKNVSINQPVKNDIFSISFDTISADLLAKRRTHFAEINFSLSTNYSFISVLNVQTGLIIEHYSGKINEDNFEIQVYSPTVNINFEQEFLKFKKSSFFLTASAFVLLETKFKLNYIKFSLYENIYINETSKAYGYYAGINYKIFI